LRVTTRPDRSRREFSAPKLRRITLSATPPDTGEQAALNGAAAREVSTAAAPVAGSPPSSGAPTRRLGLAPTVIQTALHFSGTNLEWVVNAYALAFGGLLLLGGRSGDLLGRRRIFIAGILL